MSHFFVSKFLTQNSVVVFKSRYKGDFPPFRSLYPPPRTLYGRSHRRPTIGFISYLLEILVLLAKQPCLFII